MLALRFQTMNETASASNQVQTHGISIQNKPVITEHLCSSGHDDRYKSRSVGDGNWMGASIVSSFSDVVPCQGLYFAMYLALVIHPGLWTMEVGYTCLDFLPTNKACTVPGLEFGEHMSLTLITRIPLHDKPVAYM
jgi:hypothetical protein